MTIDQLAEAVAGHLLRRGFVHDDPAAYRAGVRDAVAAIRSAAAQGRAAEHGADGEEPAPARRHVTGVA